MKNQITISNNGSSILLDLVLKSDKRGKIVLTVFVALLIGVAVFALSNAPRTAFPKIILPAMILWGLIFYFPVRYLLWNLFGSETFAITTRSISVERSYGFYRTRIESFPFTKLYITFDTAHRFDGGEYGTMGFHGRDPTTGLPVPLVQTTVIASKADLNRVQEEINKMFHQEKMKGAGLPTFSLN